MHPMFALAYPVAMMQLAATQTVLGMMMFAWSPGPYTSESNVVPFRRKKVS